MNMNKLLFILIFVLISNLSPSTLSLALIAVISAVEYSEVVEFLIIVCIVMVLIRLRFKLAVLDTHLRYLGCLSRIVS